MTADSELLELAAKATGIDAEFHSELGYGPEGMWLKGARSPDNDKYWNPLNSDGDALRLEIDLKFTASWGPMRSEWNIGGIVGGEFKWLASHEGRKRATTMAAAEIGRAMP